jgi:hypothetical protein
VISNYTHEEPENIIKNLVRTADARAQIYTMGADGKEHVDQAKLTAELNAAAKGLILGGGFIKSNDLLQFARQASAVAKSQTPEAFYANGVEAAIAMGAAKLGTAETSLMQQFIGGTMTKKVAEHLTEAGLLHSNEWHSGKSGAVVVNPSVATRFQPMLQDPIAWLSTGEGGQAVKAYAQKEGISVIASVMQLFGRQTTQRLASEAMSNQPQFARAREIYGDIPSVAAQYNELHNHDLDTNMIEIAAAWKSFMQAFSDAGTPLVIPILHGLTDAIHELTSLTADHPDVVRGLTGLVVGLSGLTVLGGSLTVLNVCWAPLAGGLRMLVGIQGLAATGGALSAASVGLGGLSVALMPFAVGGAAALAIASLMGELHDLAGFGNKSGFAPMTGGPQQGAHGPTPGWRDIRPNGVAPMPGDKDYKVSMFIAPPSVTQTIQVNTTTQLDGKTIATTVSKHQANGLSRPPTGSPGADYRISPLMPGMLPSAFG